MFPIKVDLFNPFSTIILCCRLVIELKPTLNFVVEPNDREDQWADEFEESTSGLGKAKAYMFSKFPRLAHARASDTDSVVFYSRSLHGQRQEGGSAIRRQTVAAGARVLLDAR